MEMELKELVNAKDGLSKLVKQDLNITLAFKLSKDLKKIEEELKIFEEKRMGLFKKYGEEKEGQMQVSKSNFEPFLKELEELLSVKVNIEFNKLKMSQIEGVKLSAVDLLALSSFIEE